MVWHTNIENNIVKNNNIKHAISIIIQHNTSKTIHKRATVR